MRKSAKSIKNYWDRRATQYQLNPKSTTEDFWLRVLEIKHIKNVLRGIKKRKDILDIGCGDGFSTINIAKDFPNSNFIGGDYSINMINNARELLKKTFKKTSKKNAQFQIMDIMDLRNYENKFDVVISDRCLINLPNYKSQTEAVVEIAKSLQKEGSYIMIENFIDTHKNLNRIRKNYGLSEIPVRWHNTFLANDFVKNDLKKYFRIISENNISSTYYFLTRVVYSLICKLENREPDYNNNIYRIATEIKETFETIGPIKMFLLKKK